MNALRVNKLEHAMTIMNASAPSKTPVFTLAQNLTEDARTFVRQVVQLVKAEISEKASKFVRNAVTLAAGGSIAYAGLIISLMGLGWLLAWAFQKAGLQPVLAGFLGLVVVGLLMVATGTAFLLKGLKVLSRESLAPQKTIHTIQRLKGTEEQPPAREKPAPAPRASSEEIQALVEETENRMGETLDELGRRLSPRQVKANVQRRIEQNPYRSGLLAIGAGFLCGLFLARKFRRA